MEYREFVGKVRERAGLDTDEQALQVSQATLETLSERLCGGEPRDFLAQLPEPIKLSVAEVPEAHRYSVDEFIERVSEQEGTDVSTARDHARVVLEVLSEATTEGELAHVLAQLPRDYATLIPGAGEHRSGPQ